MIGDPAIVWNDARVAEIEPGQQGRAVEREGDGRDRDRRRNQSHRVISTPFSAPRFAAMKARTSASGRVFRTCRGSTQPRRAVMTPSSI